MRDGVRVRSTLEGMEVAELEGRPISDAAVSSAPEPRGARGARHGPAPGGNIDYSYTVSSWSFSPTVRSSVVDNSRLSPYTPQSVAASLAAVKRAEAGARSSLNQSQNSLAHAQKIPIPHRFRESLNRRA